MKIEKIPFNNAIPYFKLSVAMVIIGSFVVINKFISTSFPVFLASGLRLMIGAIILNILVLIKEKALPRLSKRDFIIIFLQSFIGVFLFSFFMLFGLKYTTAIESGIITSTTPAVIGVISLIFLKEKLQVNQVVGIIFALLSTLSMNVFGIAGNSHWSQSVLGNILIFCAVISESVFMTFGKLLSKNVSALAISSITCTIGFILFLPLSIYEAFTFDFSSVNLIMWGSILYAGIFVTVIAVVFLNQAVLTIPTGNTAVFSALMPVSAVILSYSILNESIYWYHILGIIFVLLGILSAVKRHTKPKVVYNKQPTNSQ
jgi:drug/metabolite transporter (DMT)-like permease